jgi:hypothetical protein
VVEAGKWPGDEQQGWEEVERIGDGKKVRVGISARKRKIEEGSKMKGHEIFDSYTYRFVNIWTIIDQTTVLVTRTPAQPEILATLYWPSRNTGQNCIASLSPEGQQGRRGGRGEDY